jgi:hypothetical protein
LTNPAFYSVATGDQKLCGSRLQRWASTSPGQSSGVLWHPPGEHILDEFAHRLLDAVRRRGGRRLLIDGVSGFQQAALEPERTVRFWSALSHELRALGVTTMHMLEMPTLTGVDIRPPGSDISSLAEAMILLRYVELRSRLCRLISLSKVRVGAFDPRFASSRSPTPASSSADHSRVSRRFWTTEHMSLRLRRRPGTARACLATALASQSERIKDGADRRG